ncbi:MAG: Ger(x)C family spore germination protein [Clostridiaceae bacterium]|nr:Ger(x)C family spore germination protein [Clostridiaceae bacterium]
MRKRTLILTCLFLPLFITGCFDSHEIGDFAYVTALGLEQGISDTMRITFQIAKFGKSGGSSGEGEGGGESEEMETITLDSSSLNSAISIANTNVSKYLNFMHLKVIVISEDMAKSGKVRECMAPIVRYRQIRRTTNVIVCKGKAEEFVSALKPYSSELITQTIEELIENSRITGYFPKINLNDFYDGMKAPYHALLGIYGAVNKEDNLKIEGTAFEGESDIQGDYYAGDIPRKGGPEVELFGSTVFDGDKMVGKLTGFETQMLLLVLGELKRASFSITDPEKPENTVPIDITEFDKTEINIDLKDGRPKIQVKLKMEGNIASIQSSMHYEAPEKMPIIEDAIEKYLVEGIERTFNKCKEFKTDVFNFGTTAVLQFWTIPEWEEYSWLSKFPESELEVEVDFTIRRTGKILKSEPIYSSEGKK